MLDYSARIEVARILLNVGIGMLVFIVYGLVTCTIIDIVVDKKATQFDICSRTSSRIVTCALFWPFAWGMASLPWIVVFSVCDRYNLLAFWPRSFYSNLFLEPFFLFLGFLTLACWYPRLPFPRPVGNGCLKFARFLQWFLPVSTLFSFFATLLLVNVVFAGGHLKYHYDTISGKERVNSRCLICKWEKHLRYHSMEYRLKDDAGL